MKKKKNINPPEKDVETKPGQKLDPEKLARRANKTFSGKGTEANK